MNLCTTGEFPIHFLVPITNPKMLQCEQSVVSQRDYPYSSNFLMAKNKQKVSCISRTIAKVNILNHHQLPFLFFFFFLVLCSLCKIFDNASHLLVSWHVACGIHLIDFRRTRRAFQALFTPECSYGGPLAFRLLSKQDRNVSSDLDSGRGSVDTRNIDLLVFLGHPKKGLEH